MRRWIGSQIERLPRWHASLAHTPKTTDVRSQIERLPRRRHTGASRRRRIYVGVDPFLWNYVGSRSYELQKTLGQNHWNRTNLPPPCLQTSDLRSNASQDGTSVLKLDIDWLIDWFIDWCPIWNQGRPSSKKSGKNRGKRGSLKSVGTVVRPPWRAAAPLAGLPRAWASYDATPPWRDSPALVLTHHDTYTHTPTHKRTHKPTRLGALRPQARGNRAGCVCVCVCIFEPHGLARERASARARERARAGERKKKRVCAWERARAK